MLFVVTIILLGSGQIFGSTPGWAADPRDISALMAPLVSLVLLGAALWVILSGRYNDATQKWAIAAAGSSLGYWLSR